MDPFLTPKCRMYDSYPLSRHGGSPTEGARRRRGTGGRRTPCCHRGSPETWGNWPTGGPPVTGRVDGRQGSQVVLDLPRERRARGRGEVPGGLIGRRTPRSTLTQSDGDGGSFRRLGGAVRLRRTRDETLRPRLVRTSSVQCRVNRHTRPSTGTTKHSRPRTMVVVSPDRHGDRGRPRCTRGKHSTTVWEEDSVWSRV